MNEVVYNILETSNFRCRSYLRWRTFIHFSFDHYYSALP